ncbi:MAG: ASKHA domain-containing protein [Clostridiales Family XIII bacterium]|jgi:uncharacterized 2Fe-2S/4Fe-4S cluster protein (DUF4445 family)|nr:ASKHA domain-containing protein [Clostridiales Family XIII bacterium]
MYEYDMDFELVFHPEGEDSVTVRARRGESVLDVAKRVGVPIDAPCSGNGTCGKCKVRVVAGQAGAEGHTHISPEELREGYRLACATVVSGDLTVVVPEAALAYRNRIRVGDMKGLIEGAAFQSFRAAIPDRASECTLASLPVQLKEPDLHDARADAERLRRGAADALGCKEEEVSIDPSALRKLPRLLRESAFSVSCLLRRRDGESRILDVSARPEFPLGLAVDIGTTTVSALLADLSTGEPIAFGSAGNGQIRYGADVINRLIESAKPGGLERLRTAVTAECVAPLARRLCERVDRDADSVCRIAVAGNTTMAHLLLGVYGNHLRMEPYVPAFFGVTGLSGFDLDIGVHPGGDAFLAPAVGSYVGGDITAGVFASGIHRREDISLFVDLGTNGEIVLGNREFLVACACSAGPAFEGGEISCGMRATDGAIEACAIDESTGAPRLSVIGTTGQKPAGLCGSGLIDAVGELFRCGIIDARGKFLGEGERIARDEWGMGRYILCRASEAANGLEISLNEADIDNFIRAKGSVYSAIRTLLGTMEMGEGDIDGVYVAGGIGSAIDIEHTIMTGMLPNIPRTKYHYIGNTSLLGAYGMLISESARESVSRIADGMTYLELSSCPGYMDEFIAACFLPHTDGSLFQ